MSAIFYVDENERISEGLWPLILVNIAIYYLLKEWSVSEKGHNC